jgi:hypothetical protein
MMDNDTVKIRALNDSARKTFLGCRVMVTSGIRELDDIAGVMQRVAEYDTYTEDNDPHGEHDFGSFKHGGEVVFWKFDYYDLSLTAGSEDPTDPDVTVRVLTVMLASEY